MRSDQRSLDADDYRHLYKDSRWRGVHGRRAQQLAAHPLCERCLKRDIINDGSRDIDGKWQGNPKRRYLVAHHKVPHRGDLRLFFEGELETLCPDHHDLIAQKEEHGHVPYETWARLGMIEVTPGNTVNYDWIKQAGYDWMDQYDVRQFGFDRWNATQTMNDMEAEGVEIVKVGQGFASLTAPAKDVLELRAEQADMAFDDTDQARRHRGETVKNTLQAMRKRLRDKRVRVTDGPFRGFSAKVEAVHSLDRLRVAIDLLGRETAVELESGQIEELAA